MCETLNCLTFSFYMIVKKVTASLKGMSNGIIQIRIWRMGVWSMMNWKTNQMFLIVHLPGVLDLHLVTI